MLNWINKKRNKKGFTLVELVVVIAILGILAALAVPKLSGSQHKAKWAAHAANIRTIEGAIAMYEADGGNISDIRINAEGVETIITGTTGNGKSFLDSYLDSWPKKPGTYTIVATGFVSAPTKENTEAAIEDGETKFN